MVSVVSFDLNGTLIKKTTDLYIWYVLIPKIYAKKRGLRLDRAVREVAEEYSKVEGLEWYKLTFWVDRLGLGVSARELIEAGIKEVPPMLSESRIKGILAELAAEGYKLILVSRSERIYVESMLKAVGLDQFFEHTFCTITDFGLDKEPKAYEKIAEVLRISPEEILHVGDNPKTDFEYPKKAGWKAVLLDRERKHGVEKKIRSLEEIRSILGEF